MAHPFNANKGGFVLPVRHNFIGHRENLTAGADLNRRPADYETAALSDGTRTPRFESHSLRQLIVCLCLRPRGARLEPKPRSIRKCKRFDSRAGEGATAQDERSPWHEHVSIHASAKDATPYFGSRWIAAADSIVVGVAPVPLPLKITPVQNHPVPHDS